MAHAKAYADRRRRTQPSSLTVGDTVLVRQRKRNKLTPYYDPTPYTVITVEGAMITVRRPGHQMVRNSSFFKKVTLAESPSVPEKPSVLNRSTTSGGTTATSRNLVFPCPASSNGGQQRAAVPVAPAIPVLPDVPVAPAIPVLPDVPVVPIDPGPVIAAFHPPANAALPDEPFQLPSDLRPTRYNLRNRDI
jgi:hypothetical protein